MAAASAPTALTGAILVGGGSRRMGADKASLVVDGRTMLERAAATLSGLCGDVLVVAHAERPIPFVSTPVRVVRDRVADAGPLAGVDAALAACRDELLLVVPVDMPLLSPDVLRLILDAALDDPAADVVALRFDGELRPLPILLRARVAPVVTRLLAEGHRRLRDVLHALEVSGIDEDTWRRLDPGGASMVNVNVPDDVRVPRDARRSTSTHR